MLFCLSGHQVTTSNLALWLSDVEQESASNITELQDAVFALEIKTNEQGSTISTNQENITGWMSQKVQQAWLLFNEKVDGL